MQGGGKRKGSIAIYLEPWHADIFAFLDLRKNHGNELERARDCKCERLLHTNRRWLCHELDSGSIFALALVASRHRRTIELDASKRSCHS